MNDFLIHIGWLTLSMSAVILLALLFYKIFGGRFSAKSRYTVWVVIVLSLCIGIGLFKLPTLFTFEVGMPTFAEEAPEQTEQAPVYGGVPQQPTTNTPSSVLSTNPVGQNPGDSPNLNTNFGDSTGANANPTINPPSTVTPSEGSQEVITTPPVSESPATKPIHIDIAFIIFMIWAVGAILYFSLGMAVYLRTVRKYDRKLKLCDQKTEDLFASLCRRYKIKHCPGVFVCSEVGSPILYGYMEPTVLIPEMELSENSLVGILAHELTHYRRGDIWVKLVCLITESLYWFNPLVRVATARCNAEMELSCDETVLAGMSEEVRRSYGNVMLNIVEHCSHRRSLLTTHFNPRQNAVRERILNILDMTKKKRGRIIIAVALLLCIVAGTVIGCSVKDNNDRDIHEEDNNEVEVDESVYLQAQALTEQLIRFVMDREWLDGTNVITEDDVTSFLTTIRLYVTKNEVHPHSQNHPYDALVTISDDHRYNLLSLADAQKIASEVFGYDAWTSESSYLKDDFDEATETYRISKEVGLWSSPFSFENMDATYADGVVSVECDLVNSNSYDYEEQHYGRYRFSFEYITTDGGAYLRYSGLTKVEGDKLIDSITYVDFSTESILDNFIPVSYIQNGVQLISGGVGFQGNILADAPKADTLKKTNGIASDGNWDFFPREVKHTEYTYDHQPGNATWTDYFRELIQEDTPLIITDVYSFEQDGKQIEVVTASNIVMNGDPSIIYTKDDTYPAPNLLNAWVTSMYIVSAVFVEGKEPLEIYRSSQGLLTEDESNGIAYDPALIDAEGMFQQIYSALQYNANGEVELCPVYCNMRGELTLRTIKYKPAFVLADIDGDGMVELVEYLDQGSSDMSSGIIYDYTNNGYVRQASVQMGPDEEEDSALDGFQVTIEQRGEGFVPFGTNAKDFASITLHHNGDSIWVKLVIEQLQMEKMSEVMSRLSELINVDYEGKLITEDTEKANRHFEIRINDESAAIQRIVQGQGNGHVDYYLYLDTSLPYDEVEKIEIRFGVSALDGSNEITAYANLSDFLTEEQIAVYETADLIFPLFNGSPTEIDRLHLDLIHADFDTIHAYLMDRRASNPPESMTTDIGRYYSAIGEYDTFEKLESLCLSVFTKKYFDELNRVLINGTSEEYSTFQNVDGKLYYLDTAKGTAHGYAPEEHPDTYVLVSRTATEIRFNVIGYLKSYYGSPIYSLETIVCPVTMTLGDDGKWRISQFSDPAHGGVEVDRDAGGKVLYSYFGKGSIEELMELSVTYYGEEITLGDWMEKINYRLTKYSIIDLDGDGAHEMVFWLSYNMNEYIVEYLVLHADGETVYAYGFPYRGFFPLKWDGSFGFSGGAANNGIGRLSFDGDTCTMTELVRTSDLSYHIENQEVSKEEYDAAISEFYAKNSATWYYPYEMLLDDGSITTLALEAPDQDFSLPSLTTQKYEVKNCAILYGEQGAWLVDYKTGKVTLLTDTDAMINFADPTGRCKPYFDYVTLSYEFSEFEDSLLIVYRLTSTVNTECYIELDTWLYLVDKAHASRGEQSAYSLRFLVYPGSDEPISVDSLDRLDELYPEIRPDETFVALMQAFAANDVPAMEQLFGLEQGTLSPWEGTFISDCKIIRQAPLLTAGYYSMEFTIEKSTVERFPEGRYVLNSSSVLMPGAYDIERLDGADLTYEIPADADENAIKWARTWGASYGGDMPRETQTPTHDGFAHMMLDYLLGIARENGMDDTTAFTGDMYREYAAKYLGLTDFENQYTAYGSRAIDHGGHGPNMSFAEVAGYRVENGVHYVTLNYYADPFRSVVARTHTFAMVATENEVFALVGTEFVYDTGLPLMGWAV